MIIEGISMGKLAGRGLPSRIGKPRSRTARAGGQVEGPRRAQGWYNTVAWKRLRRQVLDEAGWVCEQTGMALVGKHPAPNSPVVDHRAPHRGDRDRFFDRQNLQAVSKAWHDSVKQAQEKRGDII
jgi:hypothetical protein